MKAKIRFLAQVASALAFAGSASAATNPAGATVRAIERRPNQITIELDSGRLELRPLSDSAIRVRFSSSRKADEVPSFVLKADVAAPKFDVREDENSLTLATARMRAGVDRASGAVRFADAAGNVFLAEKAGTRTLEPSVVHGQPTFVVGQAFESPADERLYGLGQYQDGLWDWRGVPLELRQLNTQIAVPVLVSSKGYGLLWDNASRTDFNSPGIAVPLASDTEPAEAGPRAPSATEQLTAAAASKPAPKVRSRNGTFTAGAAGEYVFCTRDGDRRDEMAILIDGTQIAGVTNMWTPRAVVGKVALRAGQTVSVAVRGGGKDVKLFARPLGDTTSFRSDCGDAVDYTVFYGPRIDDVIAAYRKLTGDAPLWPKWAYGFWQCRERYSSGKQIVDAATEFRRRRIPVDLIIQDWQYWGKHGWGSYEWDETKYPDPAGMIGKLHAMGVKFMISVWCNPHGKALDALKENHMVVGNWIDVFAANGREIRWKFINEAFFSIGTDGWWGDATEPGDPGTDLLGKRLSIGPGDQYTSAYPLFASRSLYEGQRATDPGKRVCILTRSAWPGMQRYAAAAWSGDINGTWETFRRQIPAGLNFCMTGQPWWTTDCGGFFHPADQYRSADYNELLTRWFQWSTFCPILRIHGYQTETEMWEWLPETQKVLLAYDRLRYRMLPYNYTLGARVTFQGDTIMRPLGMDFPDDPRAWDVSDEYMFGPAFLVAPVTEAKATSRHVYLPPAAGWVDFWTGETHPGGGEVTAAAPLETLPLFVRAGSVVPLGPDVQYATEKPAGEIELRVYPGADGAFTLYEDEGDGYRYEQGAFANIPIRWDDRAKTLTLGARQGSFPGMPQEQTFNIVFVGKGHGTGGGETERTDRVVKYTGQPVDVKAGE